MNDWLKLLVKYKGKCAACNKEIPAGEYALWSKTSKAIRHIECKATITTKMNEDDDDDDDTSAPRPEAAKVDCFICGKPTSHTHCGFAVEDYNKQAMSQACICNDCLENQDAYGNYQKAFIEKAYKLAKVKL